MNKIEIYAGLPIALCSIAYPILLQVISGLDDKYLSVHIVDLFDKEKVKKNFNRVLIFSSIFIWSFNFQPLFSYAHLDWIIKNSAALLVIISTIYLVVVFFLLVKKILIYLTPIRFVRYLIKNHNRQPLNLIYFKAISDVFIQSLIKQNHNLSHTIFRFLFDEYKRIRDTHSDKPVEFPNDYYELVHRSIEELAILKTKKNFSIEYGIIGTSWLLGHSQQNEISEVTYSWIWHNLNTLIKYEQDDMLLYHWQTAHEYYRDQLKALIPSKNVNTEQIEKRNQERRRFIEFHFALGAYLLYKKKYQCINRIFSYSNSQPYVYELLPETMDEIFESYAAFRDSRLINEIISFKYKFPGVEGVKADAVVRRYIYSYLALLFIRQYSISPYLTTMRPLDYPKSKKSSDAKYILKEYLDFFKGLVSDHLGNKDLMHTLKFEYLTEEWCRTNNKPYPLSFINNYKNKLIEDCENEEINQQLDPEKIKKFSDYSNKHISNTFDIYLKINNSTKTISNANNWQVGGIHSILEKNSFAVDSNSDFESIHSYLGNEGSKIIKESIASTINYNRFRSYLIKPDELFKAIDKLKIDDSFTIISFGIELSYFLNELKIEGLNDNSYKGIPIIIFKGTQAIESSLIILKKIDFPSIISMDIEKSIKSKLSLERINDKLFLYTSVLNINSMIDEVYNEFLSEYKREALTKKVLVCLYFNINIAWKKNVKIIEIAQYSKYNQRGEPNEIKDITIFNSRNKKRKK
jgi:hypothetical protein